MKEQNSAEVLIDGKAFTIAGFESDEYLQQIAGYINRKLRELKRIEGYAKLDLDVKNTLLAINIADDYYKARRKLENDKLDVEEKDKSILDMKHEIMELGDREKEKDKLIVRVGNELEAAKRKIIELETKLNEVSQGSAATTGSTASNASSASTASTTSNVAGGTVSGIKQAVSGDSAPKSSPFSEKKTTISEGKSGDAAYTGTEVKKTDADTDTPQKNKDTQDVAKSEKKTEKPVDDNSQKSKDVQNTEKNADKIAGSTGVVPAPVTSSSQNGSHKPVYKGNDKPVPPGVKIPDGFAHGKKPKR